MNGKNFQLCITIRSKKEVPELSIRKLKKSNKNVEIEHIFPVEY